MLIFGADIALFSAQRLRFIDDSGQCGQRLHVYYTAICLGYQIDARLWQTFKAHCGMYYAARPTNFNVHCFLFVRPSVRLFEDYFHCQIQQPLDRRSII